jgi:hypothetical protein
MFQTLNSKRIGGKFYQIGPMAQESFVHHGEKTEYVCTMEK